MRHFIKLPQVIIGETYSEAEKHNTGLNKHNFTTAQIFNDPSIEVCITIDFAP